MLLTEHDVIDAVVKFLPTQGWRILKHRRITEKGIDIEAENSAGLRLHIEAKGMTSARADATGVAFSPQQIDKRVCEAWYTASSEFGRSNKSGIAVPVNETYMRLLRCLRSAIEQLGVLVFLVSADGSVREWDFQ